MDFAQLGKSIISKGAPLLGLAVGGPAGAALGSIVANAFGANPEDLKDIIDKINNESDAKIKLLQIQDQHAEVIKQIQLEEVKLKYQSVANAQNREVELAKAGKPDTTTRDLALLYTAGYFFTHIIYNFFPELRDINFSTALNAGEMLVLGYYFGSSIGSKVKETAMLKMANK